MANNLATPAGNPSDRRPHQTGKAIGVDPSSAPHTVAVEWMVDTGAEIACLRQATASPFRLRNTGASASATTGGGGIIIKSGLTTEFEVIDPFGSPVAVRCNLDVAVKPNNAGSDILGMDQLEHVQAVVEWDPRSRSGKLRL